jgi:hypothetical protein
MSISVVFYNKCKWGVYVNDGLGKFEVILILLGVTVAWNSSPFEKGTSFLDNSNMTNKIIKMTELYGGIDIDFLQ